MMCELVTPKNPTTRGVLFLVALGCAWIWSSSPQELHSQVTSKPSGSSLQVLSSTLANGSQQVIIVDDQQATMAAYQIDPADGHIRLTSVRSVRLDLQMLQFNTETPLPSELSSVQP